MIVGEFKADLLPCPFCGGKPKHWENTVVDAVIRCPTKGCGVRMIIHKQPRAKDDDVAILIIAQWNTRE